MTDNKVDSLPQGESSTSPSDDYEVPEDDTIIARAFKRSLIAIATLAFGIVIIWFIASRPAPVEQIEDASLSAPENVAASIDRGPPVVRFTDITSAAGIDFTHVNGAQGDRLLPETMGGGVAFLDFDDDGDQDLLFINSSDWPWNTGNSSGNARSALYRNDGTGKFEDVSTEAGLDVDLYGMGTAVADYDGDGFVDVFITALGANRLLRNIEGRLFEDVTEQAGLAGDEDAWSTGASFFDYDNDGDLDLFVTNYVTWSKEIDFEVDYRLAGIGRAYGPPTNYAGTHSYLYRNNGDGTFTDVSAAAGIQVNNPATGLAMGKGLGVLVSDMNRDGWLDVLISNDTVQNFLFMNLGDGRFEEVGTKIGLAFDNSGSATGAMGIDAALYNNNGDLAVAIGNFANEMTSFYVAQEDIESFTDEAIVAGIGPESRRALSFGLFFFDYDLDGRLDLFQANGHVESEINIVQPSQNYKQPAQLFWNCGPECERNFIHVPAETSGDLAEPMVGRGAAYGDIDADGDLDIVVTQVGRQPLLLRNEQETGNHWLRLRLIGGTDNREAIGARVVLKSGDRKQTLSVIPARSYLSQVELPLTFGLADATSTGELIVHWPDGTAESWHGLEIDQLHELKKGNGGPVE